MSETLRYFLDPADLYSLLKEKGMDFYTGVPDSLLKDFCAYVTDTAPKEKHVIAANEGAAVGLATGYYLATNKFPIVYMQNSGFGNAINPLLSLCDPKVSNETMALHSAIVAVLLFRVSSPSSFCFLVSCWFVLFLFARSTPSRCFC